ncbi:MAG: site-specific DNA-methyltransferase [Bacteroidetes bacterium]|nr:site-specific DNA-methyltransferase [Bacteroidota bacterium]
MRKEDVLANEDGVFPVPLQVEKIFNGKRKAWKDGWKNIITFGDNLQFLKTIYENKDSLIKNKVKGKVKLIYIDPPFGTGDEYDGNKGQKGYTAKTKGAEFVEFLRRRLLLAREILSNDGSIFIRIDYHFAHYVKVVLDEIFGKDNFQNEIVINRFKRQLKNLKQFNHATDSIFFYSKSQNHGFYEVLRERLNTFTGEKAEPVWRGMSSPGIRNPQEREIFGKVMWPPKGRHWTFKQTTLNTLIKDGRIRINEKAQYTDTKGKKVRGLPEYLQSTYVPVDNQWTDLKGYVFNASYPTENPEELIERVLLSASKENDIVMDFFAGSGVVASVAEKLNRKWISCDIGKLSFYTVQKRILNIGKSKSLENPKKKYGKQAKSFVTVNTGQYDLEKVFNLESSEYSSFVLNLFEIEPIKKTISGIKINGERKDGYYALIWPYWEFKDASVDEDYLHNLHSNIGKKVGYRIYIVAPASYVDFISDYYEIDNVRYYFLKVPYHIIKELHKVQFKKFRQPQSKKNVNDLEDAIGFHFMKQPEVETEVTTSGKDVKISIKKFLSDFSEDDKGKELENLESLAMVLIDKDFDGNAFDMDEYSFAEDLLPKKRGKADDENIGEELKKTNVINLPVIPKKECGKDLMIIYVDIYGNEFKEKFEIN